MANVTAADVKRLREQTGSGMMDCKKALEEADGDFAKAVEVLRVKGLKGVTKREGRSATNGLVAAHVSDDATTGTLLELNCETDFVAKGERFQALASQVLGVAVSSRAPDAATLLETVADGRSVGALLDAANASIGEKIEVRRVAQVSGGHVASYLHRTSPDLPPQIGVLVVTDTVSDVARDVAMHIAAMSPVFLTREEVPAETVEHERRIAQDTARNEGKPEQALPRIIEGRVNGFFKENVLLEQAFAKEAKKSVKQVLTEAKAQVLGFARFRVGA